MTPHRRRARRAPHCDEGRNIPRTSRLFSPRPTRGPRIPLFPRFPIRRRLRIIFSGYVYLGFPLKLDYRSSSQALTRAGPAACGRGNRIVFLNAASEIWGIRPCCDRNRVCVTVSRPLSWRDRDLSADPRSAGRPGCLFAERPPRPQSIAESASRWGSIARCPQFAPLFKDHRSRQFWQFALHRASFRLRNGTLKPSAGFG